MEGCTLHAPFVSIAPWSFIKDECIVKYYPEGHYQKPEQITTTLHDALMIAQYYYECGLYVGVFRSSIERRSKI